MWSSGCHQVKQKIRWHSIALAFMRGLPYSRVEFRTTHSSIPCWVRIKKIIDEYSFFGTGTQKYKREKLFEKWLKEAEEHRAKREYFQLF